MVETEILDTAAHPCLKTHNIIGAGTAFVFRSVGQKKKKKDAFRPAYSKS